MIPVNGKLSLGSLIRHYPRKIAVTWGLTLLETIFLAVLPLLIGFSIDGLLNSDWAPFWGLAGALGTLLMLSVARRIYDTRAYGTMRVDLGSAVVENAREEPVSAVNARLDMSAELVEFLESEAPLVLIAVIQTVVSIGILFAFHPALALCAGGAAVAVIVVYGLFGNRFFELNRALNEQTEQQVSVLEKGNIAGTRQHLSLVRNHLVRLSDTEALTYGLIFAILLAMLCFNLWFAATQIAASPGRIFAIVTYSYELIETAVILPAALQSLTRISEITQRINRATTGEAGSGKVACPWG